MTTPSISIHWFRRDLRLTDNAALYHALKSGLAVQPIFIFDKNILDKLTNTTDRRVQFIHLQLEKINQQLIKYGSTIKVYYGYPIEIFTTISTTFNIATVFANHDYEPYAIERDAAIDALLKEKNIRFNTYKDQVVFEKNEITKDDGKPYTVFTPYSKKWKLALNFSAVEPYPAENYFNHFLQQPTTSIISLKEMGFTYTNTEFPSEDFDRELINGYDQSRNYPAIVGTSKLGIHLRFGSISIRWLVAEAKATNEVYLNELIWREFYQMILWHFPHVVHQSFKKEYDGITWRNNEAEFKAWCEGKTGYPIVDAGMRELNETGYMHNRVRMITASFLTKHLLIDWRWGEAYFAAKLLDFDLASNNGGWQWAAGSGCDAAPYFRVFNPTLQTQKFDAQLQYIKKWVPELESFNYPTPIVPHTVARERVLKVYKEALQR
jgi:deoxyribodipyrimidine photo-lyase